MMSEQQSYITDIFEEIFLEPYNLGIILKSHYPGKYQSIVMPLIKKKIEQEGHKEDKGVQDIFPAIFIHTKVDYDLWYELYAQKYDIDNPLTYIHVRDNLDTYYDVIFDHHHLLDIDVQLFDEIEKLFDAYPSVNYFKAMMEGYMTEVRTKDIEKLLIQEDAYFMEKIEEQVNLHDIDDESVQFFIKDITIKKPLDELAELYILAIEPDIGVRRYLSEIFVHDLIAENMISYKIELQDNE